MHYVSFAVIKVKPIFATKASKISAVSAPYWFVILDSVYSLQPLTSIL